MNLKTLKTCLIGLVSVLFIGCQSPNTPDYKTLEQQVKPIAIENVKWTQNSEYNFVSTNNIVFDIEGHRQTFRNQQFDGLISFTRSSNEILMETKMKVPLFSKFVKLDLKTDFCGKIKNGSVKIDVLNENGTVDYELTTAINLNSDVKKTLSNVNTMNKNQILCSTWNVGEVKDDITNFNSFNTFKVLNDKYVITPTSFPLKYHGVVTYNTKDYYLFSVSNGKAKFSGEDTTDNAGSFVINMQALVSCDTHVTEFLKMKLDGRIFIQGYGVNYIINNKTNATRLK